MCASEPECPPNVTRHEYFLLLFVAENYLSSHYFWLVLLSIRFNCQTKNYDDPFFFFKYLISVGKKRNSLISGEKKLLIKLLVKEVLENVFTWY